MVGISCGVMSAVSYDSLLNKKTQKISLLAIIIVVKVSVYGHVQLQVHNYNESAIYVPFAIQTYRSIPLPI